MQDLVHPTIRQYHAGATSQEELDAIGYLIAKVLVLRHWVPIAGHFEKCGRQIFDFHEGLVEALRATDIKDSTLATLRLPYPALFIRFGAQKDMKLEYRDELGNEYEFFDGVFASQALWEENSTRLLLGLTTVLDDGRGMTMPGYFLDFPPELQTLPCDEAVEAALERRRRDLLTGKSESGSDLAIAQIQVQEFEEAADLLRQALPLVINGLFYLESMCEAKDGLAREPSRDTPPSLAAKWQNAPLKRRRKVELELTSEGYSVVYLVGKEFTTSWSQSASRGSVNPHWRRGHWRMQMHGPGRSLRKRIWIRPQFINPEGRPASDAPGHIYHTGPDAPQ